MRNHGADLWAIVSHCFIEEGGLVAFLYVPLEHSLYCMQYLVECSFTVVLVSSPASTCAAVL